MVTSLTCENGRRKKQEQEQEQEHEQEVAMHGPRPAKVVGGVGQCARASPEQHQSRSRSKSESKRTSQLLIRCYVLSSKYA